MHDRKSAYERSYQLARSGGDAQLAAVRARAQEAAERPRPVSLAGVRLRDVAEQLIAALGEAAGDSDARVSALLSGGGGRRGDGGGAGGGSAPRRWPARPSWMPGERPAGRRPRSKPRPAP